MRPEKEDKRTMIKNLCLLVINDDVKKFESTLTKLQQQHEFDINELFWMHNIFSPQYEGKSPLKPEIKNEKCDKILNLIEHHHVYSKRITILTFATI